MRKPMLLVGATLLVGVLVVAAVVAGTRIWQDASRSSLQQAVALAPGDTQRFSWTNWSAVRDELGVSFADPAAPQAAELEQFLSEGYDADLTSSSALVDSAPRLERRFGFSPGTVEWELLAQSPSGSVAVVRMGEQLSFDDLATSLEELGYTRPGTQRGIWVGGADLLARIGGVTPQLQYVALDEDDRLLRASDSAEYLSEVLDGGDDSVRAEGEGPRAGPRSDVDEEGLDEVVAAVGEPLAAAVYTGSQACSSLAMAQADARDQDQADRLLEQAGQVDPLAGFAMALEPGGAVRVALAFESEDQARTNADTRAVLATGPAPGQGGEFGDRFGVDSVSAEGRVVTLALEPVDGASVLSDLSTGPVLFATC